MTADRDALAARIDELESRTEELEAALAEQQSRRQALDAANASLTLQLDTILGSRAWRAVMRYRRLRERLLRGLRFPTRSSRPTPAAPLPNPSSGEPAFPAIEPSLDGCGPLTLLPAADPGEVERVLRRHPADRARRRHDVICFSIIDWEFRFQRPQQLMSQFAAHGHRVFYISISRFHPAGRGAEPQVRLIRENVWEVQLATTQAVDVYGGPHGEALQASVLASLDTLRRKCDISWAVSYVMVASWAPMALAARDAWHWPVVYDCMDEWESFPGIRPAVLTAERALVDACDLLVVSAARLAEKWERAGRPALLARNGVDTAFYGARCRPNPRLEHVPHPIVGYYGAIADWFDVELMTHVARERPQYQFVLLGGVFGVDTTALAALPNVLLAGRQPYATMPEYAYHFDAAIIPFKVNAITRATDPVKLYEYLCAGKPVVSVALDELLPYRDLVYLAGSPDEFVEQLDRAVAERDPELTARRRRFAAENDWADRYARIRDGLAAAMPPASIVIVTHGNLALTTLCIESVLRNTDYPAFEVIVVDNASTDGTPAYLEALQARHPEVRIILNASNAGFARANNQGLAISRGDVVVLLNNDTVVPRGWLTRLLAHLRDPAVGLVGPVTNAVGNEAKVEPTYRTWGEMEGFARERAFGWEGRVAEIPMLAMFCVAMRRGVFEAIGPLDEQFGIGMFEDDDYSRRVREAGYRVVCAGDVFVHHAGQAAFRELIRRGTYDDLFETNRQAYERKWSTVWTPHRHAPLAFLPHGEQNPDGSEDFGQAGRREGEPLVRT